MVVQINNNEYTLDAAVQLLDSGVPNAMSYLMRKEGAPTREKESELQPTEKMLAPKAFWAAKLKSVATGIVSWKHPSLLF